MQNHLASDIYDPFAGSGTSLIAAEQLGRRCFAIEIEPRYVQVAIDRWEPSPDSSVFDEVESRIVTAIETEKRRTFDEATNHLRAVRERVAALQLDGLIAKVGVATDAAVADLFKVVLTGKDRLYAAKTARSSTRVHCSVFGWTTKYNDQLDSALRYCISESSACYS